MYKSGIYLWVNKITGKVYIGQAEERMELLDIGVIDFSGIIKNN